MNHHRDVGTRVVRGPAGDNWSLKMSKYDQKVEVEKTPDSALSCPVHLARKIFLKTGNCTIFSQGGPLLRRAKFDSPVAMGTVVISSGFTPDCALR